MRVIIDPEDDIQYMSFYIKGLNELLGENSIRYSFRAFSGIPIEERHSRTMRFIVENGINEHRYVIDTNDSYHVNEKLYDWCDTYGSVNANFDKTPGHLHSKLVAMCPSFAVRFTNLIASVGTAAWGAMLTHRNKRKYLGCWKRTMQRPRLEEYTHGGRQDNYVFHVSTLWSSDEWNRNDEGVNLRRARFIRACKSIGSDLIFEGGLVSSRTDDAANAYVDCNCNRYDNAECLDKTKKSAFVFNTPAYWNCHGWKLGEYMALGKAILSTPLSNDLPSPLIHGQHIHITGATQEEMTEAIKFMISHPGYRHRLENNIHEYWQQYGTPDASLKLLGI